MNRHPEIAGKYHVYIPRHRGERIITDNPREAVWEANRVPGRIIENICGERQFYKDDKWHMI